MKTVIPSLKKLEVQLNDLENIVENVQKGVQTK